jgi:aerobic C4-dicarboxylate transport protein
MKLGARTLTAMAAGILLAMMFPVENTVIKRFVEGGAQISLQIGRYLVFPFLFFNMAVAVGRLKRTARFGKALLYTAAAIAGINLIMAVLGSVIALLTPLSRIPIAFEHEVQLPFTFSLELLKAIFPDNAFTLFLSASFFPLAVLALILGINMAFDREISEPTFNLFDSLGRIFYRIAGYYTAYSFIPVFFFTASTLYGFRSQQEMGTYFEVFILSFAGALVIAFALYSFLYWLLMQEKGSALRWMRGAFPYPVFAFWSPDFLLSSMQYSSLAHQNQGIRRDIGAFAIPLFTLFGRSGTVFINAVAVIVILKSYNSLDITFIQVLQTIFYTFITSFLTASYSSDTLQTALSISCLLYGHNISSGSMVLEPIMPMLAHIASMLDAFTLLFTLRVMAHFMGYEKFKPRSQFM